MKKNIFLLFCLLCLCNLKGKAQFTDTTYGSVEGVTVCVGDTTTNLYSVYKDTYPPTFISSWEGSSNPAVATVTDVGGRGIITGISAGVAIITFKLIIPFPPYLILARGLGEVTVNALPAAAPSFEMPVCTGGTLNLFANDGGGNTYSWSGPNGFTATGQNPSITAVTAAANGTYTLIATNASGCSDMFTVDVTIGDCGGRPAHTANPTANAANGDMLLLPNPADGDITVTIPGNTMSTNAAIHIVNAAGAVVYNHTHPPLSLKQLPPGAYMIQLSGSKGEHKTGRIVIK